jgi:Lyase
MKNQAHPLLHDIPIGIDAAGQRHEPDSMGGIDGPADRYGGAQTQRSLVHFASGDDRMPKAVYHAYGDVKKAAALVNAAAGRLPPWKADAIVRAADEAIAGKLDEHFPLDVWQTGSGTQSTMNRNEVLANRLFSCSAAGSAASLRCTRTTTSTWGSRRTTPSRPPCISPPCWSWRSICCPMPRLWPRRSRRSRMNGATLSRSGARIYKMLCR